MGIRVERINGRNICIGGIGVHYYQNGFPIEISVDMMKEKHPDVEISWFHVADELIKNGWTDKRVLSTLERSLTDTPYEQVLPQILLFVQADYEAQREMIFNFLFSGSRDIALAHFAGSAA